MSPGSYVVFECGCHPPALIPAPSRDGELHSVSFVGPDEEIDGDDVPLFSDEPQPILEGRDEHHPLISKDGKWEIRP